MLLRTHKSYQLVLLGRYHTEQSSGFDPVDVPIVICPPPANTASPSRIALPETLTREQNSSPAPSQATAIDNDFIALTLLGIVKLLDTLAPAKLSSA